MIILDASVVVDLLIKPPAENAQLGLKRWPHRALLGRALALRDQLSAYDAIYVAMAEATGATLLTRDARLARATGHRARVEVV